MNLKVPFDRNILDIKMYLNHSNKYKEIMKYII